MPADAHSLAAEAHSLLAGVHRCREEADNQPVAAHNPKAAEEAHGPLARTARSPREAAEVQLLPGDAGSMTAILLRQRREPQILGLCAIESSPAGRSFSARRQA